MRREDKRRLVPRPKLTSSPDLILQLIKLAESVGGWGKFREIVFEAERVDRPWPAICQPEDVDHLFSYSSGGQYWLCKVHFPSGLWDGRAVAGAVARLGRPATVPLIDGSQQTIPVLEE